MRLLNLDAKIKLDRDRMIRLIKDIRVRTDTGRLGVEARVLLQDFKLQLNAA